MTSEVFESIRRWAFVRLGDEDDADDVTQRVLVRLHERLADWEGRARFTTWLHQVATNEAKMLIRSRSRRPITTNDDRIPEIGYLARLSTLVGDRDVIDRALRALPDLYREVLLLREVEQLGYDEIADRLEVPIGTVRSRLAKARQLLARAIDEVG